MNDLNPQSDTRSVSRIADLSDDLLQGAGEIAKFVFGDRQKRRQVYYLAQTSRLPIFKLGITICARRSRLLAWIESQENTTTDLSNS